MTTLSTGARLGPYEILSTLGAGGMGEVYSARDRTLHRDVALKVLPERFALDSDRVARFKREAQVLASLNHPNIAAIFGFDESSSVHALVLELVPGPTLADRIARGPLPLEEALPVARQIAEALEAAHEQGIIHRDLKPSNVKLRPDGVVKVLDFGLAKALEPPGVAGHDATASPTITSPAMTQTGVILGTAAYMSPEQAKGKTADRRSDLWAFGCVLYEMLTGQRAFKSDDVSDTLAAVLRSDPDWRALPRATPGSVHRLLRRCLAKDPKERIADASTARLEIDAALDSETGTEDAGEVRDHRSWTRSGVAWSVVAVLLLAAAVLGVIEYRTASRDAPVIRAVIPNPDNAVIGAPAFLALTRGVSIALSGDAGHLAFIATGPTGPFRIWVRALEGSAARPLAGTEGGTQPFWSADGRSLGFFADGKVKRVDIDGGPILTICDHPTGIAGGGTWSADGTILFSGGFIAGTAGPIYRVAASGGTATPLTTIENDGIDRRHIAPVFLPDGHHFLYISSASTSQPSVYVGSIDGPQTTRLLDGVTNVQYSQGRLLFMRSTTLVAQAFDLETMTLSGDVAPVAEGVIIDAYSRTGIFSVSTTGVLAYQGSTGIPPSQLTWFDRNGRTLGVVGEPGDYNTVNLSPDNTRAAVSMRDATGNMDIWLVDVARALRTRVTFEAGDESHAIWSPDGTRIIVNSLRHGRGDLYLRAANGSASEELVDDSPVGKLPSSWSADGSLVVYNSPTSQPKTGNDIWVLPLLPKGKPYLFLQTTFNEGRPQFSPNQRWIAYQSNESGRNEVYVAQFPGPGGKWQVSSGGGGSPRWRRDGKELFYVSADSKMMAVAVNGSGSGFNAGVAQPLFTVRMREQLYGIPYDVAADGQRFLVNTPGEQTTPASISLLINWPGVLKGRP